MSSCLSQAGGWLGGGAGRQSGALGTRCKTSIFNSAITAIGLQMALLMVSVRTRLAEVEIQETPMATPNRRLTPSKR